MTQTPSQSRNYRTILSLAASSIVSFSWGVGGVESPPRLAQKAEGTNNQSVVQWIM